MSDTTTHVSFVSTELVELDNNEPEVGPSEAHSADGGAPASPPPEDDVTPSEPVPLGATLTALLKAGLEARGWSVDYQWTTPYGHAFDARATEGKRRYDIELICKDGERGMWLVTCKQRTGLFRSLFKGGSDPDEHRRLRVDTHGTLVADPRIRELQWHREDDWESGKHNGAAEPV